ncbi:hypothetical protein Ddye_009086, partial [Dipteronia dyeriana]
ILVGPSNAVSTESLLDDSVELAIDQSTDFLGKEFVSIVPVESFYQQYAYINGLASARTSRYVPKKGIENGSTLTERSRYVNQEGKRGKVVW